MCERNTHRVKGVGTQVDELGICSHVFHFCTKLLGNNRLDLLQGVRRLRKTVSSEVSIRCQANTRFFVGIRGLSENVQQLRR